MEDLEADRLEVENADLARVDHGPDRVQACPVILFVIFPMLHEPLAADILFKLGSGDEVVVLGINLALSLVSGCVCKAKEYFT